MPTGNSQQKSSPSAPEKASSTKRQAGSELLTKPPWDPGRLTSAGRVAARDQLPRGAHGTPEMVLLLRTRGAEHPGPRGWQDVPPHLGRERCQAPSHPSCSDLGRAQNTGPTESAPWWSTQEPEPERLRPGKCRQPRAHFRQLPYRAT